MVNHITRYFPYYLLMLVALVVGDGLITNVVIDSGYGFEASSTMAPLVGPAMIAVKGLAIALVAGYLCEWYETRRRIAGFVLNIGLIIYGLLFVWNTGIFYLGEAIL